MEASTTPVPRRFAGAPKTGNIISRAHRSPWQNMPRGGKPAASPYTKLFARPSSKTLKRPGSVKKGTRTPGPAAAEPARPSPSPSPRTGTNIPRAARLAKQVTIARPSPRPKQSASPKPIAAPCANLHQEPAKPVTPAELVVHGAESRGGAKPSREAPVFKPGGLKNGAKLIKGVPESPSVKVRSIHHFAMISSIIS